jgi:HSP20 family protein
MDNNKNKLSRFDIDLTPFQDFMKQMDSFFDQSFKQINEHFHLHPFWVDVKEKTNHYLIQAELNGYTRDQIQIEVAGNQIRIGIEDHRIINQIDSKEEKNLRKQSYYKKERVINLPTEISKKDIKAVLKNNILNITVPKRRSDSMLIDIEES